VADNKSEGELIQETVRRANQIAVDTAIRPEIENGLRSRDEREVTATLSFIFREVNNGNFFWLNIPLLLGLMDHRSDEVQVMAATIFMVMSSQGGGDSRVDQKMWELTSQPGRDPELLEVCKLYLRHRRLKEDMPSDEELDRILSDLESDDVEVRKRAAVTIGEAATADCLPLRILPQLKKATNDTNEVVREWALAAIGSMALRGVPVQDALPDVIRCLGDPSPGAREWAATAVQNLANKGWASSEALPGLLSIVEGEESKPKIWAIKAIMALSDQGIDCARAVDALRDRLGDKDEHVRQLAGQWLASIPT
jgi:hypothetical protein